MKTFKITKAKNPLAVKGKTVMVRASAVAGAAKKLKAAKAIAFLDKGVGKLSYSKTSGTKMIAVNKKTGAITLRQGIRAGIYNMKVKVTAPGNANYERATKNLWFKLKIVNG